MGSCLDRANFPTQPDGASVRNFLHMHVDATGACQAVVARLSAEEGEPEDTESALGTIRCDCAHFAPLQGLDGRGFTGLEAKA